MIHYRKVLADGHRIFYREAGDPSHPTLLLLHGFPTSSHMFRDLIPLLADRFHIIAPDLPGFGFTEVNAQNNFKYTFEHLAQVVESFTDALSLERYAIYIFDYGAPVGLRLAMARPECITAIISQNGNAYEQGLSPAWQPIQAYWREPTAEHRDALRAFLAPQAVRHQYLDGVPDASLVAPDGYVLDSALLARPGQTDIQLDLLLDYASNVALYPRFHRYFAKHLPPFLAVWGKHDAFFTPAGAEAYKLDLPHADVQFLDTGHFALETHAHEIASSIRGFLWSALFATPARQAASSHRTAICQGAPDILQ